MMKASARCYSLIKDSEGFVSKAYKCPAGVLTIGFGHTGNDVKEGDLITRSYAEKLLVQDVTRFEYQLISALNADEIILNQNQFDALIDFVYNLGFYNLITSTLWKKLKATDYQGAADEFLRWNKATVGGYKKELKGLTIRRQKERNLFVS